MSSEWARLWRDRGVQAAVMVWESQWNKTKPGVVTARHDTEFIVTGFFGSIVVDTRFPDDLVAMADQCRAVADRVDQIRADGK